MEATEPTTMVKEFKGHQSRLAGGQEVPGLHQSKSRSSGAGYEMKSKCRPVGRWKPNILLGRLFNKRIETLLCLRWADNGKEALHPAKSLAHSFLTPFLGATLS